MNQSINTEARTSNSKEPQQKYRLGTVSIKILGNLNRVFGIPTRKIKAKDFQAIFLILLA